MYWKYLSQVYSHAWLLWALVCLWNIVPSTNLSQLVSPDIFLSIVFEYTQYQFTSQSDSQILTPTLNILWSNAAPASHVKCDSNNLLLTFQRIHCRKCSYQWSQQLNAANGPYSCHCTGSLTTCFVQGSIVVVAMHALVTLVVLSCVRLANHTSELVLLLAQQQIFLHQTLLTSSDWLT